MLELRQGACRIGHTSPEFNDSILKCLNDPDKNICVLSGAGVSAESGIPTFRGPEGYWTVGSKVYMPEEMATLRMFQQEPQLVWEWYLYRLSVCLQAKPNMGHLALAKMEKSLTNRFTLITQNVDNLHIRAGNSAQHTFQIHGNITQTRCSQSCVAGLFDLPHKLLNCGEKKSLSGQDLRWLRCQYCNDWLRPHVLWFDEYYNEEYFRFDSSMQTAAKTNLLIIVGTSGATTLPRHVANLALQNQACIIDINPQDNPFREIARNSSAGMVFKSEASQVLTQLAENCPSPANEV